MHAGQQAQADWTGHTNAGVWLKWTNRYEIK